MSPHDLARLQGILARAIESSAFADECVAVLDGPPDRNLARLAVYRGNSVANAQGALANAYPIVSKIVGKAFFDALAREYWRGYPAQSGDLNTFGERFAEFIADFQYTQDLPYLPDVARMEWLLHRAYYAADAPSLVPAVLSEQLAGDMHALRVIVAPACALFTSIWPLARLWEIHQDGYAGEFSVDWNGGGDSILVCRPAFRPLVARVSAGARDFLRAIMSGHSIGRALNLALTSEPAFDLSATLPRWIAERVIVGFDPCAAGAAEGRR